MEQFSEILLKRIVVKNMENTKMDLEGGICSLPRAIYLFPNPHQRILKQQIKTDVTYVHAIYHYRSM